MGSFKNKLNIIIVTSVLSIGCLEAAEDGRLGRVYVEGATNAMPHGLWMKSGTNPEKQPIYVPVRSAGSFKLELDKFNREEDWYLEPLNEAAFLADHSFYFKGVTNISSEDNSELLFHLSAFKMEEALVRVVDQEGHPLFNSTIRADRDSPKKLNIDQSPFVF